MSDLLKNFNKISRKQWEKKIKEDLNKINKDITDLYSKVDDIKIAPFYHNEDNNPEYECDFPKDWKIFQHINGENPSEGNIQAIKAIKNNVDGIYFSKVDDLENLLKGIDTKKIQINFTDCTNKFIKEFKKYNKSEKISGFLHRESNDLITNYNNTIFARGKSAKEQIISAYMAGKKTKGKPQFYFEISHNFFLEIAKRGYFLLK